MTQHIGYEVDGKTKAVRLIFSDGSKRNALTESRLLTIELTTPDEELVLEVKRAWQEIRELRMFAFGYRLLDEDRERLP